MSGNKSNTEENNTKSINENEIVSILQEKLNKELRKYGVVVSKHKNLIYRVIVIEKSKFEPLKFEPETPENPKRGSDNDYAFQKDLLIEDLLINECKKLIEKLKIIENDEKLINEYENLIKKVENYEKCEELIKKCEKLINKYKKLINKCKDDKECKELLNKCEILIKKVKNSDDEELIKKCEELVEKCEELIKNYNELNENDEKIINKCKELIKNVEITENNKELIKKCEELVEKCEEYIVLAKKCKKKFFLLPLVAIEIKHGGFDTHDILIYSEKALKHKQIYPYLRYGLVVVEKKNNNNNNNKEITITKKFFIHNKGFDFVYALNDINDNKSIIELVEMLKEQINSARSLLDILNNKKQVKKFNTRVEIKFNEN